MRARHAPRENPPDKEAPPDYALYLLGAYADPAQAKRLKDEAFIARYEAGRRGSARRAARK